MCAQGPLWSSHVHEAGRREGGATHIFTGRAAELGCTCTAGCESLPGTWRSPEVHVTRERPEQGSREGISQAQNILSLPWRCLLVFLSLCYCLICGSTFWRMVGGTVLSNAVRMGLSCWDCSLKTGLPHLSNQLWFFLLEQKERYRKESRREILFILAVCAPATSSTQ